MAHHREVLAPWFMAIEHVGSAAVSGLAVKPIIDIQVGVVSLNVSAEIVSAVESLGYVYSPDHERNWPYRRYFQHYSSTGVTTHHIHLVERSDHVWWD